MLRELPRRADDSAWRMVDGEMIVVSATTGKILALNPTGAFVWERTDGAMSVGELAATLAESFDVEPSTASRDVSTFLGMLEAAGLIAYEGEAVPG